MNKFVYPEIGSNIPIGVQWLAGKMDTPDGLDLFGNPIKRTPDGFTESMEYRIPGLRQNVQTTEDYKRDRKEKKAEEKRQKTESQY